MRVSSSALTRERDFSLATQSPIPVSRAAADTPPHPGGNLALGPALLLVAAFLAVIVFLPPEGRIMGPLHAGLYELFGRATFMLPVALILVGGLSLARARRPDLPIPWRRIAGVVLLALVALTGENLLAAPGDGTGLAGSWLSGQLVDLLGVPITVMLLVLLLVTGTWLTFDLRSLIRPHGLPDAES